MNIHDPNVSRILAAIIQQISLESQEQFLRDARNAPNIESLLKGLSKYKNLGG